MPRLPMSETMQEKIRELSATTSNIKIAEILGVERRTVARILNAKRGQPKTPYGLYDLRRREAREVGEGNFNVYEKADWVIG